MVNSMKKCTDNVALIVVGNCNLKVVIASSGDQHVLGVEFRSGNWFHEGYSQEDCIAGHM